MGHGSRIFLTSLFAAILIATSLAAGGQGHETAEWTTVDRDAPSWSDVAASPDGTRLATAGDDVASYDTTDGSRSWIADTDGSVHHVAYSPDGTRVYAAGFRCDATVCSSGELRPFLVGLDGADGSLLWSLQPARRGQFDAVAAGPHGVVATGSVFADGSGEDVFTLAAEPDGRERWNRTWVGGGQDAGNDLVVDPDRGTVYVTGTAHDSQLTIAYDPQNGSMLWESASPEGSGRASALAPDGSNLYVAGTGDGERVCVPGLLCPVDPGVDFVTRALDTDTGAEEWLRRHNGPGNWHDHAWDIEAGPHGNRVAVAGDVFGGAGAGMVTLDPRNRAHDVGTVVYEAGTGAELWSTAFDGGGGSSAQSTYGHDHARAVAFTDSGRHTVVGGFGYGPTPGGDRDAYVLGYHAATGVQTELLRYNGTGEGRDAAQALATVEGTVFAAGQASVDEGRAGWLTAVDTPTLARADSASSPR